MGRNLASRLNTAIDDKVTDETSRADIITQMGSAAGIEAGTVNQILDESIDCPPLNRLEGFAEVLDVSASTLINVAESDGCDYSEERAAGLFQKFFRSLRQLFTRRIKDVDSWSGSASRWDSTEAYCDDCLIDVNAAAGREEKVQSHCMLPVREPGDSSDTFVRQAVFAAAGGRGITQVSKPDDVSSNDWNSAVAGAARTLVRAYGEMGQEPPESVQTLTERAISSDSLRSMIWQRLLEDDRILGQDNWLIDVYFDSGQPYALVTDRGKLYRYTLTINDNDIELAERIEVMEAHPPVTSTRTTIRRQQDGRYRWFSVSATSVLNRVAEIDSRDLFDSFVSHIEATNEYPVRQFYHQGEQFRTGQADFVTRDGNTLITSGLFDDSLLAQLEVQARERTPGFWGESIGYCPTELPEMIEISSGINIPIYRMGVLKEISTLPEREAASLFTVTQQTEVRRMLTGKVREAFNQLFNDDEEAAQRWLEENVDDLNRSIQESGLITRDDKKEKPEDPEIVLDDVVINELVTRVGEGEIMIGLQSQMVELTGAIDQLRTALDDAVQATGQRLDALEEDDDQKRQQWQEDLPANGKVKVTYRPREAHAVGGEDVLTASQKAKNIRPKGAY